MAAVARRDVAHQRSRGNQPRGSGQERLRLAHLARFREATYSLLSQAFLYPDEERSRALATAARELRQEGGTLARFAFFGQWSRLLRVLEGLDHNEAQRIQGEYISLFVVSSRGVPCPPYESVYRARARCPDGWLLAQVEREYAAAGFALAPTLRELPDHVAVEMEFMALLCGREAQAWEERSTARGVDALRRQKAFLDSHLALWFSAFAGRVAAADRGGIYAALGQGAQAFVGYDRDLMDALLETPPAVTEAPWVGKVHATGGLDTGVA